MKIRTTMTIITWLAGGLLCVGAAGCPCDADRLDDYLTQRKFVPFDVPVDNLGPGTVMTVGADGAMNEVLCMPDESVGAQFQPGKSPTASIQSVSNCGGSVDISASLFSEITASASFSSVENVAIDLTNAYVLSIDGSELDDLAPKYRSAGCSSEIEKRLAAKETIVVVTDVYQADYKYTITYDTSVSANVQLELTKEISAKLGAKGGVKGTDTISGQGLYWGYKTQPVTSP